MENGWSRPSELCKAIFGSPKNAVHFRSMTRLGGTEAKSFAVISKRPTMLPKVSATKRAVLSPSMFVTTCAQGTRRALNAGTNRPKRVLQNKIETYCNSTCGEKFRLGGSVANNVVCVFYDKRSDFPAVEAGDEDLPVCTGNVRGVGDGMPQAQGS